MFSFSANFLSLPWKSLALLVAVALVITGFSSPAHAAVSAETSFIFNTFSFLVHGFLVLWMAAGFAALESGLVRTKSVTTILLKNITLFSIAGIAFYLTGYNLMYDGVDGGLSSAPSAPGWADDRAALAGDFSAGLRGLLAVVLPDALRRDCRVHRLRHAGRAD